MGQMVQTREEIDRFMAAVDPKLFGLSPDTAHLDLAGCDVVGTLEQYKHRIHFLDYKDARRTTPDGRRGAAEWESFGEGFERCQLFFEHLRPGRWGGGFSRDATGC